MANAYQMVALMMTIANEEKIVIKENVKNPVKMEFQVAQKADTVILITMFAFYLVSLIRIVVLNINALNVAIVRNLVGMTRNVQIVINIVTSKPFVTHSILMYNCSDKS